MTAIGALLFFCFATMGLGILASLVLRKRSMPMVMTSFGTLMGLASVGAGILILFNHKVANFVLWSLPGLGRLQLSCDRLSAIFVIVAGLIFIPVSLFSAQYLKHYFERTNLRVFSISYLTLLGSIVLIPIAGDVFTFLLAWEVMTLLCYLLVNADFENDESQRASFLMLAMSEAGTLAVLVAFLILSNAAGTLTFVGIKAAAPHLDTGLRWAVFLLSFLGFSVKVGLVPFNSWLPRAHPVAPANISALLSGLILNLGVYGILRVNLDILPVTSVGPGLLILITGAVSAIVGILYATTENDLKKLLAHSSIENMGITIAGMGAGLVFLASGKATFASMAFIAAFYHMTNHSVYKSLLFLGAGTVDMSAGTRDLNRLGGLLKRMPWTGLFVLIGALSISAMPPFNGFVSEWLTLESLLRSVELSSLGVKIAFVAAGVGLALTAGLAVTCFVRAFAMGFLGMPRSEAARGARETSKPTLVPMAFLALVCLALGVLPTYVIPAMDRVVAPLTGASGTSALVPPFFDTHAPASELPQKFVAEFHDLGAQIGQNTMPGRGLAVIHRGGEKNPVVFAMSTSYMFVTLILLLGISASVVWLVAARHRKVERRPRWDGGVRHLLPEMTYTATGFAQPVRVIFEAIFRPQVVDRRKTVAEHFRMAIRQRRKEVHLTDRLVLHPLTAAAQWLAGNLARMHNGRINAYAGYALLALVIFLTIASVV
ncbi:MAG: hypothetical protein GXP25_00745 [Planctomycetes bacterium]|nr:hypothetical protein [Planctomycetota bacterium]